MKNEIRKIEKAMETAKITGKFSWDLIGVNATFGKAYQHTKEAGNDLLNFDDVIWDYDVEGIVNNCREFGVKEFTISAPFSNVLEMLAKFEDEGCKLQGLTKVKDRYTEGESIPAFLVTVGRAPKKKDDDFRLLKSEIRKAEREANRFLGVKDCKVTGYTWHFEHDEILDDLVYAECRCEISRNAEKRADIDILLHVPMWDRRKTWAGVAC